MSAAGAVRAWRIGLIVVGVAILALAVVILVRDVSVDRAAGLGLWLVGALVVHDGVVAAIVFVGGILLRRTTPRIPLAVVLIVQGAVVVWAIVTALVLPEIIKQRIGTANPSILPLDYVANLGLFTGGLAVVTVAAVVVTLVRSRRRVRRR